MGFMSCAAAAGSFLGPKGRGASSDAARAVRCGGCGRSYEVRTWLGLPLVGTLTGDAIAAHVVKWPHGVRIEVRRCARCARSIARTVEPV
jgi:hypothetical protein